MLENGIDFIDRTYSYTTDPLFIGSVVLTRKSGGSFTTAQTKQILKNAGISAIGGMTIDVAIQKMMTGTINYNDVIAMGLSSAFFGSVTTSSQQAKIVEATVNNPNRIALYRSQFNVGNKRNIAYADYNLSVDGKLNLNGTLVGVSGTHDINGTVPSPRTRIFSTVATGSNSRMYDSEVKILENIASNLKPNSTGTVYLHSERAPCISCSGVIKQFNQKYPKVNVIVIYNK